VDVDDDQLQATKIVRKQKKKKIAADTKGMAGQEGMHRDCRERGKRISQLATPGTLKTTQVTKTTCDITALKFT